jgi:hypothetical protein
MKFEALVCVVSVLGCGGLDRQVEPSEGVSASIDGSETATAEADTALGTDSTRVEASSARSAVVEACVESFPPTTPFDAGWPPSPSPAPTQPGVSLPLRTAEPVVAECAAHAGTNCDAGTFISKQAANCAAEAIAPAETLGGGVGFRTPWLVFNANTGRVEWSVTAGVCCGETWQFQVDATNGASTLVSHTDAPLSCTSSCANPTPQVGDPDSP